MRYLLIAAVSAAAGCSADPPASKEPKVKPPPAAANAWSPGEGFFPDYPDAWRAFHGQHADRAKQGGVDVVFLGDSITQGWGGDGKAAWAKQFEPLKSVNFGIGGDTTSQVLWRLDHGTLTGLTPEVVVLLIGTNNRWRGVDKPADVAKGIAACAAKITEKAPAAKVLLLDVFPAGAEPTDAGRKFLADVNAALAQEKLPAAVTRLDVGKVFVGADGVIAEEVMPDALHLSVKGYGMYADALKPAVEKLLAK